MKPSQLIASARRAMGNAHAPFPCGACRQVIAEFCPPHVATANGAETILLGKLLPHGFGTSDG